MSTTDIMTKQNLTKKGILGVMLLTTLQDKTRVKKETEVG